MSLKLTMILSLAAVIALDSIPVANAQWVEQGTLIAGSGFAEQYQMVVADGKGGSIIAWQRGTGTSVDLYAQRLDGLGNVLWTANGVAVCTATGDQLIRDMVSDDAGGAIIIWDDHRSGLDYDVYAQRIDPSGNTLWGTNGVPVAAVGGNQSMCLAVSDGAGGAMITWQDGRSLVDMDIYAQRIDALGSASWTSNGIVISADTLDQNYPAIVSDGLGGAIITWMDFRSGTNYDLYAQRVDNTGSLMWPTAGRAVCTFAANQYIPSIVSDGIHGAIICWADDRSVTNWDSYAQRIDDTGWRLWNWDGVPICTASGWQRVPEMIPDGEGGAFMTWDDSRGPNDDIYAQRVDDSGNVLWTVDGVAVRIGDYDAACCPDIVSDGMGGIIIAWEDVRITGDEDIYAQRLDGNGNAKWQANGIPISKEANSQYYTKVAPIGPGSTIITWYDFRNSPSEVYAQRVDNNSGYWGSVAGEISSAKDAPKDQGGKVEAKWDASRLDAFGNQIVTHYSVWRSVPPLLAASISTSKFVDPSMIGKDFQGPAYRIERTLAGNYYWEWVGNTTAQYFSGYSYAVPTLSDSMASHPAIHYFEILTHTSDPYVFWTSQPDSGYSVDNLSPAPPQGLVGDYSYALGKLTLNWQANTEADLSHYAVYRDSGAGFVPSGLNRIATATDTMATNLPYPPEQPYFIKLSALDIHGNESVFAILPPESVTTPTMVTGFESSWRDGYVEVSWEMSEAFGAPSFVIERKDGSGRAYSELSVNVDQNGRKASFRDSEVTPGETYSYRVGSREVGTGAILFETSVSIPALKLALYQNYPNPLRSEASISFELPGAMSVELAVFDARGRKVAELVKGHIEAGLHKVPFSAGALASGVYFYKLRAGAKTFSRKMIIMH